MSGDASEGGGLGRPIVTGTDGAAEATVDDADLAYPLPVLKAQRALRALKPGALLHLRATDPGAAADVPLFCRAQGHDLLRYEHQGEVMLFTIRKKSSESV